MSVPPFAVEYATPPIACDGILSPIERHVPPPVVDSHTPPVAGAANTRFGFAPSDANAVMRPERFFQPSMLGPLFTTGSVPA